MLDTYQFIYILSEGERKIRVDQCFKPELLGNGGHQDKWNMDENISEGTWYIFVIGQLYYELTSSKCLMGKSLFFCIIFIGSITISEVTGYTNQTWNIFGYSSLLRLLQTDRIQII